MHKFKSKHAFLIMAHSNFELLEKLILCLDDNRNECFIHIDKKCENLNFNRLSSSCLHSKIHILSKRIDVEWGTEKQIDAELALFEEAYRYGPFERYHLLSGTDLPIKSNNEIHNFFHINKNNYLSWSEELKPYHLQRLSFFWPRFKFLNGRLNNWLIAFQQWGG